MSYQYALKARRNFPSTISYSFCCSKSPVAMISSIWLHCLVKTPNAETPNTRAPKGQHTEGSNTEKSWYQLPKLETEYYIILLSCHVILIYHIALIHHKILIYIVLISHTLITIIHHPGIISHHTDIMSCWYIVWYHIIWYEYFNCWYNIIRIYRRHGNNLRYQN